MLVQGSQTTDQTPDTQSDCRETWVGTKGDGKGAGLGWWQRGVPNLSTDRLSPDPSRDQPGRMWERALRAQGIASAKAWGLWRGLSREVSTDPDGMATSLDFIPVLEGSLG